ncbi:trehalose 6-phosphate synthase [Nematocida minor]|uniref:trehalose 6-phosphate synthase n=1 Tax=Nematocida minor TaxID=1912983 RepID=UPI00221EF448|nr:trehalose 6-phosphate synthase [Nematocida minor]KAI5192805.1 trehalose 6-phosphate synthase [Nematocida minor]
MKNTKLIVVSNRLPLKAKKEEGKYTYTKTSGGLVTGLSGAQDSLNFTWMGTLEGVEPADQETVKKECIEMYNYHPIFIEDGLYDKYYNNLCNGMLWPILHSFSDLASFSAEDYIAYKKVNAQFAEEIAKTLNDGDMVWVHDYHLMLLPEMIRKRVSSGKIKIGYFLHIPFPSYSILKGSPILYPLIRGILGSDLVAFHTFEYLSNFANACEICPIEESESPLSIKIDGRSVKLEALPIGIDPLAFQTESMKKMTKDRGRQLKERFGNKKIILGIDRVDYIKGIPHRIKAFSKLLEDNPELSKKVVFCQVGVPSRTDVTAYATLSDVLCRLSGSLNSSGRIEDTSVYFINNTISFMELCALYSVSDVCAISSLRDGMNLVALEFVACMGSGVLVMSDYAGAAGMLTRSVYANPWDIRELSEAYKIALEMPEDDRISRKTEMQKIVSAFTAEHWANRFISILSKE